MPTPSVSVIVPNFNRENLIGETISNLLVQTLPPSEIIVVDDGSRDKSVAVIRSFGDRVKLIEQTNQGPGAARNAGLRIAKGEFIQFQDSDDLFSLNKLEAQARLLERSGADIAFSPWVKVQIENQRVTLENHVLQQKMPSEQLPLACWWLRDWSTVFQSLMFRRSFLQMVGVYRTDLKFGEDGELFFRALTSGPRVAFTSDALSLYRLHNSNKLTQDEGSAKEQRIYDWGLYLRYTIQRSERSGLKLDFVTRSIFLSGIRKHLRYLRSSPEAARGLADELEDYTNQMPALWLGAVQQWLRLAERIRLHRTGSRWMAAYQAGSLTESQGALIRSLGFIPTSNI